MGKTSLATHAAEQAAPQFDRVLFITTKSQQLTSDGAVAISTSIIPAYHEILDQMAHLLGLPHIAKMPEDERAPAIKAVLQSEKVLLILDNLENLPKPQQNLLFEFVQNLPPSCKAIITSRRRTDVEARIIRLEKLERDAALALLEELANDRPLLAKATPEDRLHLYEETGGNPLLLRWIAGQLGRGSCRTIATALDLCGKAAATNNPLEFIFGDLLETFTSAETQTLAALTYFTQKVAVQHIAELAGLSETATQTALADLANRALVMPDETEEQFALVPMVAAFLRNKRPEVVAETGDRLEKHSYALIVENGYREYGRFAVLEAAWPSVAAAIPRFLAGPNERLQRVCDALFNFLNFTGRWDEWLALNQQAEVAAAASGDYWSAGWRVYHVGWVNYLRGQADAVLQAANRAADHWKQPLQPGGSRAQVGTRERGYAIRLRGLAHALEQDYPAAIAACHEALELLRSLSAESEDVASALNDLATMEHHLGDLPGAERDYREALRLALALGETRCVATYTGNLAVVALAREDWPEAEKQAREVLAVTEKLGHQQMVGLNCHRVAKALAGNGKPAEGLPYARRAVEILARHGSRALVEAKETLAECETAAQG